MEETLPLHSSQVQKLPLIINRLHTLLHLIALSFLVYYRVSFISQTIKQKHTSIFPHVLIFASELILAFIWLLNQAYRWRPITRKAFPERLQENQELPAIDVFICTADPVKEPTFGVMNTVISAMALDYPHDKLNVYLHDDGGSLVTLEAMREAWRFAKWWIPFCRKFRVKTLCPEAYFSGKEDVDFVSIEFEAERNTIKEKYEVFIENVTRITGNDTVTVNRDHSSVVEVIHEKYLEKIKLPLLVYVSREKRPNHPHHFKAGALNVLLRVSNMISSSPYILGLDCDMYCNDPNSAREAMCFFLDQKLSHSLMLVQFPQKFHNISKSDIYDSQLRSCFTVGWQGMDGLKGPVISGTCYYMKREAIFSTSLQDFKGEEIKHITGTSYELKKSLQPHYKPSAIFDDDNNINSALVEEIKLVASCAYEMETNWGKEVGFRYFSVVEDYFTSLLLHCKGWNSLFYSPTRPAFLGSGTTNLNDVLVQGTRWSAGLVEVAISRFSPLIYGSLRMSILQSMCYAELAYFPFYWFPMWCLATIPPLCLLNNIPLYPQVSSSYFAVFSFIFLSAQLKHMQEILSGGGTLQNWMNEQRMWMIKSITMHFYGSLNAIMEKMGIREASFSLTNKVEDDDLTKRYQMGTFDFRAPTIFLAPLCTLVILNLASLLGGVAKAILSRTYYSEMFIQIFLSLFVVVLSYPFLEAMFLRMDKGRITPPVTRLSVTLAIVFLTVGKLVLI